MGLYYKGENIQGAVAEGGGEVYSKKETVIGTWEKEDGTVVPVYRIVANVGTVILPTDTWVATSLKLDNCNVIKGTAIRVGSDYSLFGDCSFYVSSDGYLNICRQYAITLTNAILIIDYFKTTD